MIACIGRGEPAGTGVIGDWGKLPWDGRIPGDMKRFKALTMGKAIIMGRKTFESLDGPLEGRTNIVLSNNQGLEVPKGVYVATNKIDACRIAHKHGGGDEIMVIGGGQIFKLFLPEAVCLHFTFVEKFFEGSVYFPQISLIEWKEETRSNHKARESFSSWNLAFTTYNRVMW